MPILQHGVPQKLSRTLLARISKISHPSRHLFTQSTATKPTPIRTGLYTTAFVLSAGVFAVYYLDARSALHRYILNPILRKAFDAETGHKIAVKVLKSGLAPRDLVRDDERLKSQVRSVSVFPHSPELIFLCRFGEKLSQIPSVWQRVLTRMEKLLTVQIACHFQRCLHTEMQKCRSL